MRLNNEKAVNDSKKILKKQVHLLAMVWMGLVASAVPTALVTRDKYQVELGF